MEEKKESPGDPENRKENNLEIDLGDFDLLEGDGIKVQCINSSEFVVGKQTSFNGPVTIINYPGPGIPRPNREEIIIKDQVLSKSAAMIMEEMAKNSSKGNEQSKKDFCGDWWRSLGGWSKIRLFSIPIIVFLAVIVGLAVSLAVIYVKLKPQEDDFPVFLNDSAGDRSLIYTKQDWKGEPATSVSKLKLPVPFVIISHSVTSQCFDLMTCSSVIYNMQAYHLSQEWRDIAYNFLVDSSGNIYEGRGWADMGELEGLIYVRSININFIGDYSKQIKPTEKQLEGVQKFIDYGVENNKISKNYSLILASATFPTLSPGKQVYEAIKNWTHFDPNPKLPVE